MYQALYRKYRSKTFDELVGQDHITAALKHQIKSGEFSHAYLFSGTRGTGKTSAAKIFSRAVNCPNQVDGNPCNECEICKGILEDRIMDVVEMDAASNNGVDDIRELKEKVIYPPSSAKYKVYIIDEVHMLSKGAFNALLKILEESPKHLIFILATTEPEKIPQTILSRTQRFNFKRIAPEIIVRNLREITEKENKTCDDEVYRLIANNSDGAMRDALSLLDQLLSFGENHISYKMATEILGIVSNEIIFELTNHIIDNDINSALISLDKIYRTGKDISNLTNDLIEYFRNLLITKTVKDPLNLLYTTNIDRLKEQCEKIEADRIINILKILNETIDQVKYAPDKRVIFEMNLIKITSVSEFQSLENRIKELENIIKKSNSEVSNHVSNSLNKSNKTVQQNENSNVKETEYLNADENISKYVNNNIIENEKKDISQNNKEFDIIGNDDLNLDIIKEQWEDSLNEIKSKRRLNIAALLREADLISFNNNTLVIEYSEKFNFHYNAISSDNNLEFLKSFFSEKYNRKIDVKITLAKGNDDAITKVENFFGKENIDLI